MESIIKRFHIEKLFEKYNVDIIFEDSVKILVGENGIGKTTILNTLYYTITANFEKLKTIDFERILIEFASGQEAVINRDDVFRWKNKRLPIEFRRMERFLSKEDYSNVLNLLKTEKLMEDIKYKDILRDLDISVGKLHQYNTILNLNKGDYQLVKAEKIIGSEINGRVLYLPTYRRIEEELLNLIDMKYKQKISDNELIKFGLEDVEIKIEDVKNDIKSAYRNGFSKISSEILTDMVNGKDIENINFEEFEKLKLIVERLDDSHISKQDKIEIREFIDNKDLNNSLFNKYGYFLEKFIKIYEEQRDKEQSIIDFVDVCNNYLYNKKLIYDESKIDVFVRDEIMQRNIKLNKLSSGEKQIVSLFASLYLENDNDFFVLFDEPELSLSIEWQQRLLPDIINSNKCKFLMAVTHSPFIFENDLDHNAFDLDVYLEEIK